MNDTHIMLLYGKILDYKVVKPVHGDLEVLESKITNVLFKELDDMILRSTGRFNG